MLYFGNSDKGLKRPDNQDSFALDKLSNDMLICIVCDGMGGANGGSVASSIACEAFRDYVKKNVKPNSKDGQISFEADNTDITDILKGAVAYANAAVLKKSTRSRKFSGMGTTLVAAIFHSNKMYVVNIGDSRLYSVSEKAIKQLTHDHSYVQTLVDLGKLTPEEAAFNPHRNIITKAIGIGEDEEPDVFFKYLDEQDENILLCSDGLTNFVSEEEIHGIFKEYSTPEEICRELIKAANSGGGGDNITTVVVKIKENDGKGE